MPITAFQPSEESRSMLRAAVARSRRTSGIQLPSAFVRAEADGTAPPLAEMLRGGRSGAVRLKLYLSLVLVAVRTPHELLGEVPAAAWARTLALTDPEAKGARRVNDALKWLRDHRYIELESRSGRAPTVRLLSATGSGGAFQRPTAYYLSVPLGFWRSEWINALSGSGVALLLILLDLQGRDRKRTDPVSLAGPRRRRYDLSDEFWSRSIAELKHWGLLYVGREPVGGDWEQVRMRNTYWVDVGRLDESPADPSGLERPGARTDE